MTPLKMLMAVVATILMSAAAPAGAVDGCKVLLCLAGPWQNIAACVSEVEQLFQDLLNGDAFPSCSFASGTAYTPSLSNEPSAGTASAANSWLAQWAPEPDPSCPPEYVTTFAALGRVRYGCQYRGVIALRLNGQVWSRTFWKPGGGSVTELSTYAQSVRSVQQSAP
jgi:hypothetical protein